MILERIPGSRFSRVLRAWEGMTVAVLAGGPSLTRDAFQRVREAREADRLRVIAINDSYLLAPWADVHYAADAKWHRWHTQGIEKPLLGLRAEDVRVRWAAFMGQRCTIETTVSAVPDSVHVLRCIHGFGLSNDPERLVTGKHGGFQCVNIPILAGAKKLLLLGFDARNGADGQKHWHGDHPVSSGDGIYAEMRRAFSAAEKAIAETGVEVLNCSPTSAIDSFPKVRVEEALCL